MQPDSIASNLPDPETDKIPSDFKFNEIFNYLQSEPVKNPYYRAKVFRV